MEDVWWYIAQDNPVAADKISDVLYEAYSILGDYPHMGHKRTELTLRPFRFWPVHNYLIIYNPQNKPIEIIHVLSGYRDLEKLLDDEL